MTDKRLSRAAKHVKGTITEAIGKLTGDKETEAHGAAQKKEAIAEESILSISEDSVD